MNLIILLIFPLLAKAKIKTTIALNPILKEIAVNRTGTYAQFVTDKDFQDFNVTYAKLNKGLKIEMGVIPDGIYLKDPTKYGDVYKKFEWDPVKRSVRVTKAKVIDISNEDVVINVHEHINNSTIPIKAERSMYAIVENTARSSLFIDRAPQHDTPYEVELDFKYGRYKYNSSWRNDSTHTLHTPIGAKIDGFIWIQPSQTIVTKLFATKTTTLFELEYKMELVGDIVVNFDELFGKYYFWAPSVKSILIAAKINNEIITTEQLEVRSYLNPRLEVRDKVTGKIVEPPLRRRKTDRIFKNRNGKIKLHTRVKRPI